MKIIVLLLLIYPSLLIAANQQRFIVLDVGEGQALLLQQADRGILIDTGHAGQARQLLDKIQYYGIEQLEAIILTHLHPDHASAYFRLKEAYPNVTVYDNCHALPATIQPDMTRWLFDALNSDPLHRCLKAGDNLKLNHIGIQILWPEHIQSNNLNEHSLVILIQQDNTNILIMGDAGITAEKYLIEQKLINSDVNLIVIGHHGAADATTDALLQVTKPVYTAISVNAGNIRGYPSDQTLTRLNKIRIQVLRTDQSGDLCFEWQENKSLSYTPCIN